MFATFRLSALSLLAVLAVGSLASAEETVPTPEALQAVESDIAVSAEKQAELLSVATAALGEQEKLSDRLVTLAGTVAQQEQTLAKAEKSQIALKKDIAKLNLALAEKQDVIAEVLAGLQRLEHNPPPALVVAPDDVLAALRSAIVFGAVLPELKQKALALHDELASLKMMREQLAAESKSAAEALTALNVTREDVKKLMAEKKAVAATSQEQLAIEKQRAEDLAAKATSLKQLLAALAEERAKAEALASAEEKARVEAERQLLEKQLQPQIAFSQAKEQINYPVLGRVLKVFGIETGFGGTLDGIVIETEKQAQVTSPVTGKIEFAGKFRSYGEMVIVNPGDGYLVLLASLDHVDVSHGQSIKAGEPVGSMGDKPSKMAQTGGLTKDLTNAVTPMLYVEFRHNGDPVDPTPWWIGTRQEAMR